MRRTDSQKEKIKKHLQSGKVINPKIALGNPFYCTRLSPRIGELEEEGLKIKHKMVYRGEIKFCQYSLKR